MLTINLRVCIALIVLLVAPGRSWAASVNLLNEPFTSEYTVGGNCWDPGTINMTTDPAACHALWITPPDFEGESFAAINGSLTANQTVLDMTLTNLIPDSRYTLMVRGANLCCRQFEGVTGTLDWLLNGTHALTQVFTGPGVMHEYALDFTTTATALRISALVNSNIYTGADYGVQALLLDDTVPAPEPASMLLLGTGLLGVARAVRKKRLAKVSPYV